MTATDFFSASSASGLVVAMQSGNGSAHADAGIHGAQGSGSTQGIAADVAAHINFCALEGIEQATVRTSAAHHRRTAGNGFVQSFKLQGLRPSSVCG